MSTINGDRHFKNLVLLILGVLVLWIIFGGKLIWRSEARKMTEATESMQGSLEEAHSVLTSLRKSLDNGEADSKELKAKMQELEGHLESLDEGLDVLDDRFNSWPPDDRQDDY